MKKEKYEEILEKLNKHIYIDGVKPSVSPNSGMPNASALGIPRISKDMRFDVLTNKQQILIHSLLHKFYSIGGNESLSKEDIKYIHNKIKERIKHYRFDKLDDENDNR